ncbi:unnamed protein product [Arctogadus glacialis]
MKEKYCMAPGSGEGIQEFLEEGTALDPRFKGKNRGETAQAQQQVDDGDSSCDEASSAATEKRTKLSALEELFMDEDIEVGERNYPIASQRDKVKKKKSATTEVCHQLCQLLIQ